MKPFRRVTCRDCPRTFVTQDSHRRLCEDCEKYNKSLGRIRKGHGAFRKEEREKFDWDPPSDKFDPPTGTFDPPDLSFGFGDDEGLCPLPD